MKTKFNLFTTFQIFKQVISSVSYLHSIGVVHGDINPTNIIIIESNQKMLDKDSLGKRDKVTIFAKLIGLNKARFIEFNQT
mmetsp:Transcript_83133/g.179412  ORF Transcript_83133/g.179412 Transcript_83133/m.179412 type:complete len:81 (+) Transcript_83133:386-628(+)